MLIVRLITQNSNASPQIIQDKVEVKFFEAKLRNEKKKLS